MASSSLSSVVSSLVRSQLGSSVPGTVTDEDLDKHVAELILKEAKQKAQRYIEHGVRALLPEPESDPNLPRTNKRFLSSIIRNTDEHNKAVIRAQAEAAQDLRLEREESERRERRARAAEASDTERLRRLMDGSSRRRRRDRSEDRYDDYDSHRSKRRRSSEERSRHSDRPEYYHRSRNRSKDHSEDTRGKHSRRQSRRHHRDRHEDERNEDSSSHRTRHRSREHSEDTRDSRSNRESRRQHNSRHVNDRDDDSNSQWRHGRNRSPFEDEDDQERTRDRERSTREKEAKTRRHRSGSLSNHTGDLERRRSPSVDSHRKRESHSGHSKNGSPAMNTAMQEDKNETQAIEPPVAGTTKLDVDNKAAPSANFSETKPLSTLRSSLPSSNRKQVNEKDKRDTTPPTRSRIPQSPTLSEEEDIERLNLRASRARPSKRKVIDTKPSTSRTSTSPGPSSPPQLSSKMDKYFEESYDPRLDVGPLSIPTVPSTGLIDNTEYEAWDVMLELIKQRRADKTERKRLEKLGLLEPEGSSKKDKGKERDKDKDKKRAEEMGKASGDRWALEGGGGLMDIKYEKKGSVREWDMGKAGF